MQQELPDAKIVEISFSSEMLGKFACYVIHIGQNIYKKRFSDFSHLHEALTLQWPGCFIPPIPEKQSLGNLDQRFLRTRRRLLQHFLDELKKRKVLWNSIETQVFFSENSTYPQMISPIQKYQESFTDYINQELTLDMKCTYYDFQSFIVKTKPMIENFKKMCTNYVVAKTNFNTEQLIFVNYVLPEFEKNLLFHSEKKFFEKIKPLDLMKNQKYDQVRKYQSDQILIDLTILENDLNGYIEAFEQIRRWEDKILKLEDKIRQNQLDLQQTINNQRNAVSKLLFGSKEKEILRLQANIEQFHKDMQSVKLLINITISQISLFEIPDFTKEKEGSFFKLLKIIGTIEMENFNIVGEYWQGILDSRIVSDIVFNQQQNYDSVLIVEQKQTDKENNQQQQDQQEKDQFVQQ